jgi:hypothetical protein
VTHVRALVVAAALSAVVTGACSRDPAGVSVERVRGNVAAVDRSFAVAGDRLVGVWPRDAHPTVRTSTDARVWEDVDLPGVSPRTRVTLHGPFVNRATVVVTGDIGRHETLVWTTRDGQRWDGTICRRRDGCRPASPARPSGTPREAVSIDSGKTTHDRVAFGEMLKLRSGATLAVAQTHPDAETVHAHLLRSEDRGVWRPLVRDPCPEVADRVPPQARFFDPLHVDGHWFVVYRCAPDAPDLAFGRVYMGDEDATRFEVVAASEVALDEPLVVDGRIFVPEEPDGGPQTFLVVTPP